MIRIVVAAMTALLFLFAAPGSAMAHQVVTTTADGFDGTCDSTNCTLRDAVSVAVNQERVILGEGTYEITDGPLELASNFIIDGEGARLTTIESAGNGRVGYVAVNANVTVQDVTVTGGRAQPTTEPKPGSGGAFAVDGGGVLVLLRSAIVGNAASNMGGGIYNLGALRVTDSTIADNEAGSPLQGFGGGIYAADGTTMVIRTSTISGNAALDGVESAFGAGGGLYLGAPLPEAPFSLDHVTIADNQAVFGAGLYHAGNGGGLAMRDTLLADNFGDACGGTPALMHEHHNLADDTSCGLGEPGDLQVASASTTALGNFGGGTDTHALQLGSRAIDAADAARCPGLDQRGVATAGARCDIGAFESSVTGSPGGGGGGSQNPPPPPPADEQLPPPVVRKSVNALPKSGTVKVKLPGTRKFIVLAKGQQLPVGTVIDTRKGRVTLIAASNKSGGTATATFYDGIFKIGQTKGSRPITELTLVEKLTGCKSSGKASAAAKKKKVKKRRLWGNGKGRFRTKGKHSAATVVGTKWLVEDRCTSTRTRVARARVSVRDFVKRKTVIVKAGRKYVARAR
jgi:CSLREA domain-containing protein